MNLNKTLLLSSLFLVHGCTTTNLEPAPTSSVISNAVVQPKAATAAQPNPCTDLSSSIPIIRVLSAQIPVDRTRVDAQYRFYDKPGANGRYSPNGSYQSGSGTIHARGQGSLGFPKKSFSINLGKENPLSLMGMASSHKWVMIGNYIDTSHLTNKMSYDLYAEMGHYGPESRHVQLCFNDQYWGLYTFGEKVNRGEGRVDTRKKSKGGFIVKLVDNGWNFTTPSGRQMQYEYPDCEEASEEQKNNIRDKIKTYEEKVISGGNWREDLNEIAESDYFIITDAFANPDSYYQDKNLFYFLNKEDKLEPVIWDFIWSFGPPYYTENGNNPWPNIYDQGQLMYGNRNLGNLTGYNRFCLTRYYLADKQNVDTFKQRYQNWRTGANGYPNLLSDASILARWEKLVAPLNDGVYEQDRRRWDYIKRRYTAEEIRDKLLERLKIMDQSVANLRVIDIGGSCTSYPSGSCPQ
ncbi:MAG: CotH kinase family protein [Pseudomonadota bacterium]